ncbi:twitching motility protein PilT [Methylobacterium sp. GXS13]|uniref:type II toxin-antitoxin system VapC family toxin n=1 Tax=Methylobacterium sp. GXS13 TaxID=1730094 RepID=UPI00071B9833|nr:type II toxin-antitoxin system VapC family toxin [Methylobacterium sp. GXS13]KST59064.1 twitching motility protein PilT [Methylobacterium sp. GXS13]
MIAIDTSALMAILQNEPEAARCIAVIEREDRLVMSAATVAEALIVSERRNVGDEMGRLIDGLAIEIVSVTVASAGRLAACYRCWGKGLHPAGLNFGNCFAYDVAKEHGCPLLYVGEDFSRTDLAAPV